MQSCILILFLGKKGGGVEHNLLFLILIFFSDKPFLSKFYRVILFFFFLARERVRCRSAEYSHDGLIVLPIVCLVIPISHEQSNLTHDLHIQS